MSRFRVQNFLWSVAAVLAILASLPGCESKPLAPDFQNPFDPQGPTGGQALNLTAALNGNTILLLWDQPQGFDIATYDISHSFERNTGFEYVATVDHSSDATTQFTYADPDPTRLHYFKVQAFSAQGGFTIVADQTPALVATGPAITVNGDPDTKTVASRHLNLTVTVTSQDSILISENADFSPAVTYQVIQPGVGQDIIWDFPQAQPGDTLTLFAKGYTGSFASVITTKELTVDFAPEFFITGKPATVPSRLVDLEIDRIGVEHMRFALSEDALAAAAWLSPDSTLTGFLLGESAGSQTIYWEFEGDFGFNATDTWDVQSDLMQDATFQLDLPADRATSASTV